MPLVLTEFKDQIGWITLNHDAKRNALSFELLSGLRHALTEHKKNLARVVVIRSNKGAIQVLPGRSMLFKNAARSSAETATKNQQLSMAWNSSPRAAAHGPTIEGQYWPDAALSSPNFGRSV